MPPYWARHPFPWIVENVRVRDCITPELPGDESYIVRIAVAPALRHKDSTETFL